MIKDVIDRIVKIISEDSNFTTAYINVGDPRQDPPPQYPHINIYSTRTNFVGHNTTHNIMVGIGVKNSTINISGKVTKYQGFYDAIDIINKFKNALLSKSLLLMLEFYDETIETVDMHGIYAIKITVVCQDVNTSKGY